MTGSERIAYIIKVVAFAVAFSFVEAAVVVYLRHLLGGSWPAAEPMAATLIMLASVASLAAKRMMDFAAFLFLAFGV